ncbi:MAG: glycosyltransferase [Planctomycetes bacterium]|nr:glycosyltransferase [Planctomycetota bacterium]
METSGITDHQPSGPSVSFVLATHNRRAVVLHTVSRLLRCGLNRSDYEIIVVDNASSDGTAVAATDHADVVLRLARNAGSCAKTHGVERAKAPYVVFLDDDSFPQPGAVARMLEHFGADEKLGAAGFTVVLPDGRREGAALPGVFVGCGVGFRTDALRAVGGIDPTFFMQAEEYDLSFRLVAAGWRIEVFDDLVVDHLKTAHARRGNRTAYYDVRNNLRVAARYLPAPYYAIYREDLLQRYLWLAQLDGHMSSYRRGVRSGRRRGAIERWTYRRHRLTGGSIEFFYRWDEIRRRMTDLVGSGVRKIIFADLGKNIYAFHQAARALRVEVLAIGDDRFSARGSRYRGIPVLTLDEALDLEPDAVVVGNTSSVHGEYTYERVLQHTSLPVHFWFGLMEEARAAALEQCPTAPNRPHEESRRVGTQEQWHTSCRRGLPATPSATEQ